MSRRLLPTLALVLTAIVVAAGCSSGAPDGTSPVRLTLSTGTPAVGQATYSSLPEELGYWEQEGLDVTINELAGSSAALQSVDSGQGDVTVAGTSALMLAATRDVALQAYYTSITRTFQSPAVTPESPIRSFRDLAGRTVGVQSLESGTLPIIRGLVEADGADPAQVRFVAVGLGAEALTSLRDGRIDALGLWDDRYADIENLGQPLRVLSSQFADELGFQVAISAKPQWLEQNPRAAVGFARAIAKASVFAQENPEAAVRLHWEAYPATRPIGVDEGVALEQGKRALLARAANSGPVDGRWGYATPDQVRTFQDLLVRSGTVAGSVDPSTLWTDRFIGEVNQFDQDAVRAQARSWTP